MSIEPKELSVPLQRLVRFHFARGTGVLARRSAIRVCHPGPVAFQRAMTSGGNRRLISCRGLAERGRPPFFRVARSSISSVSSGSSSYSEALIVWASDLARSDLEVRREAGFFTAIGFSHAKYVTSRTSWGVADHDQTSLEDAEADDPALSIILAQVLDLDGESSENFGSVFKVKAAVLQSPFALGWVVGYAHKVSVDTLTRADKHGLHGSGLKAAAELPVKSNVELSGTEARSAKALQRRVRCPIGLYHRDSD